MIRGMTGYGRSCREQTGLRATVEIRTVNHRFCEVQLRMPRLLAALEADLKRHIAARLGRGRADVFIHLEREAGEAVEVRLNRSFVEGLQAACETLQRDHGVSGELDLNAVLTLGEALSTRPLEVGLQEAEHTLIEAAVDEALDAVQAMRDEEGRAISADLAGRLERVARLQQGIEARAGEVPRQIRRRLEQRLSDLLPADSPVDPGRLEQEVALLAERADVTEELVRLAAYVDQARRLLGDDGETGAGRRLEFLLQEMHREINTVGSKAADAEIGSSVVELKQELERIREQVQNVA